MQILICFRVARQYIIDIRSLNLCFTFRLWTVRSLPVCVHAAPHRHFYNIGVSSTIMENSLNGKLLYVTIIHLKVNSPLLLSSVMKWQLLRIFSR